MSIFITNDVVRTIEIMHFLYLFIAAMAGLATLLVAEYGWHKGWWHGEGARKLAHIGIGVQVAVWPLYLDWFEIRIISIALAIGFVVSMKRRWFASIGSVSRLSYGEVLFALMIGGLTLITQSPAVYAAAILHLSLADGAAALVGQRWGRTSTYRVFGHTKSVAGTAAFFVISVVVLTAYALLSIGGLSWQLIVLGALGASFLENVGILGLDNLLVPIFVVALLRFA